jgi:hypothetical protein
MSRDAQVSRSSVVVDETEFLIPAQAGVRFAAGIRRQV